MKFLEPTQFLICCYAVLAYKFVEKKDMDMIPVCLLAIVVLDYAKSTGLDW